MANPTGAFGLRPARYRNGSPWDGKLTPYYIGTGDATALFIGDPVILAGDANASDITHIGGRFAPGALASVTRATAGTTMRSTGVVCAVMAIHRDSTTYREASTERILMVADDPNIVFQIRDDGTGALGSTTVGLNANLVAGAGSAVTGFSGFALDGNDPPADTVGFQLKILGLSNILNNALEDFAVWDVIFNQHTMSIPSVGVT